MLEQVQLSRDIPSECARKLLSGAVDIGLVPVAVLPQMSDSHIITNYCIGCDGPVHSVCIYSEVPIEQVQTLLLDYQSRTSVTLARVLAAKHWNIAPQFVDASEGFESAISGTTAAVVIGDRTFSLDGRYKHVYDLGAEWNALTGLPFVFAAWVANKPVPAAFEIAFSQAIGDGVARIEEALAAHPEVYEDATHAAEYLHRSISYPLDAQKRAGLDLFLQHMNALEPLKA